jgi:hypothetical protein
VHTTSRKAQLVNPATPRQTSFLKPTLESLSQKVYSSTSNRRALSTDPAQYGIDVGYVNRMFTEEIISIVTRLGLLNNLKELEVDLVNHENHFISKTTLSPELVGATNPKILFGYNGLHLCQLLLFRSKSLIEGSIVTLNHHNILSSLTCIRAHFETTGKMALLLKRLKSYYEGNIDFETIDKDLSRLFLGSRTFELEEVPDPVQVMDLIDSVDHYIKKYLLPHDAEDRKFRSLYDDLSDYCHPNFHGLCCGSEIDNIEKAVVFHTTGTMQDIYFPIFFDLNMSSRLFLHFYEESANLLKQKETMPVIHQTGGERRCLMIDVFQITEVEGKFYISPLSARMNGKYLIECPSKANAEEVRQRLLNGNLPLPIENNASYDNIGDVNGTPIYRVKQN